MADVLEAEALGKNGNSEGRLCHWPNDADEFLVGVTSDTPTRGDTHGGSAWNPPMQSSRRWMGIDEQVTSCGIDAQPNFLRLFSVGWLETDEADSSNPLTSNSLTSNSLNRPGADVGNRFYELTNTSNRSISATMTLMLARQKSGVVISMPNRAARSTGVSMPVSESSSSYSARNSSGFSW